MKQSRGEQVDKYDLILGKYDWHSPRPPRNYAYGIGRGAKAFVTSGELTTGLALSTIGKPTKEENDFFNALDRLEEKPQQSSKKKGRSGDAGGETEETARVQKLSMDDLAGFSGLGMGGAKPTSAPPSGHHSNPLDNGSGTSGGAIGGALGATTSSSSAAVPHPAGGFLTIRSARNEAVDSAEEYLFSDERGITLHDLLRGKNSATQSHLLHILEMGSPDEQGTWITHARALREMGLAKKAQQTLQEGCARTGKQGPMIWLERLSFVSEHDFTVRRRILEEATAACPGEEQLWLQLLLYQPPHERINCLQRAVIACPQGEELWLRVVHSVPSVRDQKRIITQALQRTQDLPLLWSKLARLESSFEMGKQIFNAAARRFPSLSLILEAAKFAEWSTYRFQRTIGVKVEEESGGKNVQETQQQHMATMHKAIEETVTAAAQQYLDIANTGSRNRWMEAAQEACTYGDGDSADKNEGAGQKYVWTAAYMFLHLILPKNSNVTALGVQPTWLEDLLALLDAPFTHHGTLCALWAAWLLLEQKGLLHSPTSAAFRRGAQAPMAASSGVFGPPAPLAPASAAAAAVADTDSEGHAVPLQVIDVLRAAVETAPESALGTAITTVLMKRSLASPVKQEPLTRVKKEPAYEDGAEEEEELPLLTKRTSASAAAAPATVKQEDGLSAVSAAISPDGLKGGFTVTEEDCIPPPFSVVFDDTLSLAEGSHEENGKAAARHLHRHHALLSSSSRLTLVLAKAFYSRRQYRAALLILQLAQRHGSSGSVHSHSGAGHTQMSPPDNYDDDDADADDIVAASAKCYAALGMHKEADACLADAIAAKTVHRARTNPSLAFTNDLLWVKLAVHRRSGLGEPCDLETFLAEATSPLRCPRSQRLWLMRIEAARCRIAAETESPGKESTFQLQPQSQQEVLAAPARQAISQTQMRELRALCEQAVSSSHCPASPALWSFIAVQIEAELFNSAAAARARLLDASIACGVGASSGVGGGGGAGSYQQQQRQAATVDLGVARARVELLHAGPSQALEVVRETLQQLPKTSDGGFTLPVGELLQLSIDLEVPAARGRAAAMVVRQRKSREPLALLAVAKVYHAAGHFSKALDQAVKAATEGSTALPPPSPQQQSRDGAAAVPSAVSVSNGWGDCAALVWKMAHRDEYRAAVAQRLGLKDAAEGTEALPSPLTKSQVQGWLLQVLCGAATPAAASAVSEQQTSPAGAETATTAGRGAASFETLKLTRGPLWIRVSKARDPTNVTLLGYRDSIEEMLKRTADLIVL